MNIEKLRIHIQENNVIANYRKVCEVAEMKVCAGNTKVAQLKELERFFDFHKEGNKFVFTKFHETPLEKIDGRKETKGNNNIYGKYIEQLVLDLLVQKYQVTQERKIYSSRDNMLRDLSIVNENYSFGKFNQHILSNYIKADSENVKEFYILNNRNLYETVERAFASLTNKCLISWKLVTTIASGETEFARKITMENGEELDIYDVADKEEFKIQEKHETATDEELDIILYAEKSVLLSMGLKSKKDAFLFGKYSEFNEKVCKLLNKTSHILYYYKSYDVIFHELVVTELEEISQWVLEQEEKQNIKVTLNGIISNNIVSNTETRQSKAIEEEENTTPTFGKSRPKEVYKHMKLERRCDESYIEDNKNIVDTVINHKKGNITNQMSMKYIEDKKKSEKDLDDMLNSL